MTNPVAGEYRSRTTGLIIFGILEVGLGALCLLLAAITFLGGLVAAHAAADGLQLRALAPALGIYVVVGVGAIWLGIGSVLARRWARALWVCLSGGGLVMGLISLPLGALVAANLPRQLAASGQPKLPPAALLVAQIAVAGVMAVFYVIIPGAIFLFYRSPHVRRTCEVQDPVERWTDRCPLPVLCLSLFAALGGLCLLTLLGFGGFFPLFGTYVTGVAGGALILLAGGAMLGFAWGLYRLRVGAWWGLLALMVVLSVSGTLTIWRTDFGELYARMGFDRQTVAVAAEFGRTGLADAVRWMAPVWGLPWIVWLLCVRRHFRSEAPSAKR